MIFAIYIFSASQGAETKKEINATNSLVLEMSQDDVKQQFVQSQPVVQSLLQKLTAHYGRLDVGVCIVMKLPLIFSLQAGRCGR